MNGGKGLWKKMLGTEEIIEEKPGKKPFERGRGLNLSRDREEPYYHRRTNISITQRRLEFRKKGAQ